MVVVSCGKKRAEYYAHVNSVCKPVGIDFFLTTSYQRGVGSNPCFIFFSEKFCLDLGRQTSPIAVCDCYSRRGCPSSACKTRWTCRQTWSGLWASTPGAEPVRGGLWTFPSRQRQNHKERIDLISRCMNTYDYPTSIQTLWVEVSSTDSVSAVKSKL